MRDLLETTCRVEARGEFVAERLIVDKAVCVRRANGLFIKMLGIELGPVRLKCALLGLKTLKAGVYGITQWPGEDEAYGVEGVWEPRTE